MAFKGDNNDAVSLVKHLKDKTAVAAALLMIKFARRDGISPVDYTRSFQDKYITENQDKLDPNLVQRFLRQRQDEVLQKLRKSIPKPTTARPAIVDKGEDGVLLGGGSLDWFDEWCGDSQPKRRKENMFQLEPKTELNESMVSVEKCAMRNLHFIESMMRIGEESESTVPVSVCELQALLSDDVDNFNQFRNSPRTVAKSFSEDSGLGASEEVFSESACNVNYISAGAVRFAIDSSNATHPILHSVKSIVNFVKTEIQSKPVEVFTTWRGSIVESSCDVLNKYAKRSPDCRELMLNLVTEVIEDVWSDKGLAKQNQWEKKIYIVNEMLLESENGYEVLKLIAEKVDYFIQCLIKKDRNVPLMTEKLFYLLDLYCCVCENIKKKRRDPCVEDKRWKRNTEEEDVTSLWKEMWCAQRAKDKDKSEDSWVSQVEDSQIEILERLTILCNSRYPLLSLKAVTAFQSAKQLSSKNES